MESNTSPCYRAAAAVTATSRGRSATATSSMRSCFRRNIWWAIAAGLVLAAIAAAVAPSRAPAQADTLTRVTVKMTEYRFRLSVNHVPKGTVVFTVLNKGQLPHTFEIQRLQKVTPVVQPGGKSVLRV